MRHHINIISTVLGLIVSSQVLAGDNCSTLVNNLKSQARTGTLTYHLATNSLSGWSGYSSGRLVAPADGGLQSSEPGRQVFSDRKVACQGSSCQPQTFAVSQADLLSVAIGEVAMTLTFHTWNYTGIVSITCQGRTIFGRQGNEFHVLTFK